MIADSLLTASKDRSGAGVRNLFADALVQSLKNQLGPIDAGASATIRISTLVTRLNQLHYEAYWEAGAEGPRLLFGRCPYAAVIRDHPELCKMDTGAISGLMQQTAKQVAKIDPDSKTGSKCVFSLR